MYGETETDEKFMATMYPDTYQVTMNVLPPSTSLAAGDLVRGKIYFIVNDVDHLSLLNFDIHTGDMQSHDLPFLTNENVAISVDERTGKILIYGQHRFYVIDPMTYSAALIATIESSSATTVYASNSIVYNNIVYVLTYGGEVYGFDLDTGAEVCKLDLDTGYTTYELVVAPRCIEWDV
jgi:hypothetical protein